MLHIFGYLKRSWKSVAVIIVLLVLQASCDLTLPQYTSNLVDVGIQQSGIDHAAPRELRAETMDDLTLFLSDAQRQEVMSCYEADGAGRYVRTTDREATLDRLDEILSMPMVAVS